MVLCYLLWNYSQPNSISGKSMVREIDVLSDDVPSFFSEGTFSEIFACSGSLMIMMLGKPQGLLHAREASGVIACSGSLRGYCMLGKPQGLLAVYHSVLGWSNVTALHITQVTAIEEQ